MEIIYFFIGAVTVAVLFSVGWLLKIVQMQIKQIHNLEDVVNAIVSNDSITILHLIFFLCKVFYTPSMSLSVGDSL